VLGVERAPGAALLLEHVDRDVLRVAVADDGDVAVDGDGRTRGHRGRGLAGVGLGVAHRRSDDGGLGVVDAGLADRDVGVG
jgi:hypothetical protein